MVVWRLGKVIVVPPTPVFVLPLFIIHLFIYCTKNLWADGKEGRGGSNQAAVAVNIYVA